MADQNKVGRPLKFGSVEELQQRIDEYFASCYEEAWFQDKQGNWQQALDRFGNPLLQQTKPFTVTGLALHLDTTRDTLIDYEGRDEFSDTIKKAKTRCELYTEEQLFNTSARNMVGLIFNLKNNYGWKDKQDVDLNAEVEYKLKLPPKPGE